MTIEKVILIHGLGGGRIDMWPLARHFRRQGYDTVVWKYPSFRQRIERVADRFGRELSSQELEFPHHRFHIVTHSMGGIVLRKALMSWRLQRLGRVVLLSPPNKGSHVARRLAPCLGWMLPSLYQLSDSPLSFVNSLSNPFKQQGIEFGIVEASKDRVIAQGGVDLEGNQDYVSVKGHHGLLPWYPETIRLADQFIQNGRFQPTS